MIIIKLLRMNIGKEIILKFGVKNTVSANIEREVIIFNINLSILFDFIKFFNIFIFSNFITFDIYYWYKMLKICKR